jgi:hypothetical protein
MIASVLGAIEGVTYKSVDNRIDIQITTDKSFLVQLPERGEVSYEYEVVFPDGTSSEKLKSTDYLYVGDPALYRDLRVLAVSRGAARKEFDTIQLTIITDSSRTGKNEKTSERAISRSFNSIYKTNVINYQEQRSEDSDKVLYIYPQDIETDIRKLGNWKERNGYRIEYIPVAPENNTTGWIMSRIQAFYALDNPPSFIVLFGDVDGAYAIPTFYYEYPTGTAEGDHQYTLLEGDDILEDVAIGRISFSTSSELLTIINKTIGYESMENVPLNWQNRVILESDTDESGISTYITNLYVKELMQSYNPDFTFTELVGPNPSVSLLTAALNQGVSYFNYRGFLGMSDWDAYEAYDLTNGPRLPIVTTITCDTGSFAIGLSRTEAFLRAGTPQVPAGAVAAIGCSTADTHTTFNNLVDGSFYEALFQYDMETIGQALLYAKNQLFTVFSESQPGILPYNFQIFNLMGDPTLRALKGVPQIFAIDDSGFNGSNSWSVSLSGLNGAEYFYSLWSENNGMITSGYSSNENLSLGTNEISGEVKLLITAGGYRPVERIYNIVQTPTVSLVNLEFRNNESIIPAIVPNLACEMDFILQTEQLDAGTYPVNAEIVDGNGNVYGEYQFNIVVDAEGEAVNESSILITALSGNALSGDLFFHIPVGTAGFPDFRFLLVTYYPEPVITAFFANTNSTAVLWDSVTRMTVILSINDTFPPVTINPDLCSIEGLEMLEYTLVNPGELEMEFDFICGREINPNITHYIPLNVGCNIPTLIPEETLEIYWTEYIEFNVIIGDSPYLWDTANRYQIINSNSSVFPNEITTDWTDINPDQGGAGINTGLVDTFEENDSICSMDIPFDFTWYDRTFSELTISTNGWVSLGVTGQTTAQNWRFPGPLGPQNMLAPFWDDLITSDGGVYTFYDTEIDRFIIQWDCKTLFDLVPEIFQLQLYPNGDVIYLYHTVNAVDDNFEFMHGSYFTTGFEGDNSETGFEYAFNNEYHSGASPLTNGTALYISSTNNSTGELFPGMTRIEQYCFPDETINIELPVTALRDQIRVSLTQDSIVPWLEIENGGMITLAGDQTYNFNLNLAGTNLSEGDYETLIFMNSTDPTHSRIEIPVILHIADSFPQISNYLQSPLPDLFALTAGRSLSDYSGLIDLNNIFQNPYSEIASFVVRVDPPEEDIVEIIDNKLWFGENIGGVYEVTVSTTPSLIPEDVVASDSFMLYCLNNVSNEEETNPLCLLTLEQNYPNPFNPTTTIAFTLLERSPIKLLVYNVKGQCVRTLKNGFIDAGHHEIIWNGCSSDGKTLASGIYFYSLQNDKNTITRKMILMK